MLRVCVILLNKLKSRDLLGRILLVLLGLLKHNLGRSLSIKYVGMYLIFGNGSLIQWIVLKGVELL